MDVIFPIKSVWLQGTQIHTMLPQIYRFFYFSRLLYLLPLPSNLKYLNPSENVLKIWDFPLVLVVSQGKIVFVVPPLKIPLELKPPKPVWKIVFEFEGRRER